MKLFEILEDVLGDKLRPLKEFDELEKLVKLLRDHDISTIEQLDQLIFRAKYPETWRDRGKERKVK